MDQKVTARRLIYGSPASMEGCDVPKGAVGNIENIDFCDGWLIVDFGQGGIVVDPAEVR
jgi:hypothetical protein